jgi:hypothetical protein
LRNRLKYITFVKDCCDLILFEVKVTIGLDDIRIDTGGAVKRNG